ncbi:MAG TPA: cytochrome c maturation protein CcmE [Caulobacteraceae bacterium]|nr:cytochrome c maturation protein CcmE [Caulobacteraceae bacterium]
MSLLPKSRTARRRLMTLSVAAPVLVLAVAVALYAMRGSISFFYTPSQAAAAHVPTGQAIQLGGMVRMGSVVKKPDGEIDFVVADKRATSPVTFKGELPDLFREGQGVVAIGAYDPDGVFVAKQILAKHDEKYMPPELAAALKKQGEWRGDGAQPTYGAAP